MHMSEQRECLFEAPRPLRNMRDFTTVRSPCREAKEKELTSAEERLLKMATFGDGFVTIKFDRLAPVIPKPGKPARLGAYTEYITYKYDGEHYVTETDTKYYIDVLRGEPDTAKGIHRLLNKYCRVLTRKRVPVGIVKPGRKPEHLHVPMWDEEVLSCEYPVMDTKIRFKALRIFVNTYDARGDLIKGSIYTYIDRERVPEITGDAGRDAATLRSLFREKTHTAPPW